MPETRQTRKVPFLTEDNRLPLSYLPQEASEIIEARDTSVASAGTASAAAATATDVAAELTQTYLGGTDAISDAAVETFVRTEGARTRGAMEEVIGETTAVTDGAARTMKAEGDNRAGVLNWRWDSASGYLLHLTASQNSEAASAALGIGTDRGAGSAAVLALKNDGNGLQIGSHPSHAGKAVTLNSYGKAATPAEIGLFAGSKPLIISQKKGTGFPDGETTEGSTTFTSASAGFTSADVGAALSQLTSRGEGFGVFPQGVTIASVTNGTTVTMSAPSTRTASGINFMLGGRQPSTAQEWLAVYDAEGEKRIGLSPAVTEVVSSRTTFWASPGSASNGTQVQGSACKFYTAYQGQHVAHEIQGDAFAFRLRHYAGAARGAESAPVQSFIATQVSGVPRVGFLGATAIARPVVTGSRSDGTALASLLAGLAALGLITNDTTA
ncbi:hypothetical protein [Nesterenkonia jeotgali]|uniref:Uncharacterized protein n=1 Tax=Nesterenkonia jeotgali TaxID=317018 RepID=A0A0W8ICX9_9MICC|nr:hypothetical protein [Nesterenkonia jeotgali]KUG57768.1 hypothetical protein AVL63_04395 [Nesterenkonia jeotgali]